MRGVMKSKTMSFNFLCRITIVIIYDQTPPPSDQQITYALILCPGRGKDDELTLMLYRDRHGSTGISYAPMMETEHNMPKRISVVTANFATQTVHTAQKHELCGASQWPR